jgi:signal transduction histidine kinase
LIHEEQKRAQLRAGNRKIIFGRVDDLSIKGDLYKLNQVLGNLVDNAIKYTPDGGAITLSIIQEGKWASIKVTDTGVGISAENIPHLFDRFYRVCRL